MNSVIQKIENIVNALQSGFESERHVVAEIYHKLRNCGLVNFDQIRLECPYPMKENRKCDIFIDRGLGIWIEVKAYFKHETPNTRSGKHTHDKSKPNKACDDLMKIRKGKKLMIIYQDIDYEPIKYPWSTIESKCKNNDIIFIRKVAE